jgi:hypothetical protein
MARSATTIGLCQNIHGVKRFDCATVGKSIQLSLQKSGECNATHPPYNRRIGKATAL